MVDMRKDGILSGCVRVLFCWHVAHLWIYSSVHFLRPGHQKCLSRRSIVRSRPGCPLVGVSWFLRRICRLSDSSGGTTIFPSLAYSPSSFCMTSLNHFQSSIRERWRVWLSLNSWRRRSHGASAVLTKIWGGRSVRFVLSFSPLSAERGRDSMSAVACSFPGTCLICRL